MDSSSFMEDSMRDSLNMSQHRFINAATKKSSILRKKVTKVDKSLQSLKGVSSHDIDEDIQGFTPIVPDLMNNDRHPSRIDVAAVEQQQQIKEQESRKNNYQYFGGNELKIVKEEYLKCRKRLKAIDTLAAGVAIVNGALAYLENEYFRYEVVVDNVVKKDKYESSSTETNLRFIIIIFVILLSNLQMILFSNNSIWSSFVTQMCGSFRNIALKLIDLLIFFHYKLKFEKLKIELKRKRSDSLCSSQLCVQMIIEFLVCSFFTPPYLDYSFSGKMLGGNYTYSLNDLIVVASLMKSYTLVRLYYHYSRWTTPDAEELCKSQNVKNMTLFPFKCELKYRPFYTLFFILIVTLVYISLIIRILEITFVSSDGKRFAFEYIYNSMWLVIITMTTVGYGDIYPQTHFGRFFGVISCLIGMLLVSYLVVGMNSLFDFTPQEQRAYGKLKKLTATDYAMQKAANVIKTAFKISKNRKKRLHKKFIYFLLLKKHISLFKNENKIAHSRLLPTDQMIKNLEEKLRTDLHELRDNIFELANFEERCEQIRIDQDNQYTYFTKLLHTQEQIAQILLEYNNTVYNEQANKIKVKEH